MPALPKIGSLESIVLAKMIELPEGITYLDFAEGSELNNPEKLEEIVNNLRNGMFESDEDNQVKFDS